MKISWGLFVLAFIFHLPIFVKKHKVGQPYCCQQSQKNTKSDHPTAAKIREKSQSRPTQLLSNDHANCVCNEPLSACHSQAGVGEDEVLEVLALSHSSCLHLQTHRESKVNFRRKSFLKL